MSLPCIKFFTYTVSYIFFIVMVLVSSLDKFASPAQEDILKFSTGYPNLFQNYTDYVNNPNISQKFYPKDFYLRHHGPDYLDIAICVYLLGTDIIFFFQNP